MNRRHRLRCITFRVLLAAMLGTAANTGWALNAVAQTSRRLLVGAYYYLWNPENFAQGTLRAHLVPEQAPSARLSDSESKKTATRDITEARQAGIDFFAIDWWPDNGALSSVNLDRADRAMSDFLSAPNLNQIKFCMFYETWNLGFDAAQESTPVTPEMETHFDGDMVSFARRYFGNPSYLRIDGRPVVFLYLTRTLTGDVAGLIGGARSALASYGIDPFFVGDEVYWRVTPAVPTPGSPILTTDPQVARIELFDAITAYTLYYGDPDPLLGPTKDFIGYPGTTSVVTDELGLLRQYRQASGGRVPVIPDVSPGFNDRGVRLAIDHPAQPRQWLPGDGPSSTLDHLFKDVAVPSIDPGLPMVMVTAWNEWNEDTGIEPIGGVSTTTDDSPSGDAYTQGYAYGGEGSSTVRTLRNDIDGVDKASPLSKADGSS
jgi:glycoprotein endo-alpha-1,2-mannosidase